MSKKVLQISNEEPSQEISRYRESLNKSAIYQHCYRHQVSNNTGFHLRVTNS